MHGAAISLFFSYPRVLGHEICGEIIGLGKNILNLKSGQQVAVIPLCRLPPVSGLSERPDKLLREDFGDRRASGRRV